MRLLRRHLLLTLAGPFAFAWIAQTGMLMLNQLSRRLGDLVGKGLPGGVILEVLLLFIPFIVALTLPMAILVAVLYGFTQMGSDNELTAMRANGVSVFQMLRPVVAAGLALTLVNFLFIDQVLPRTNLRLLNLQSDIQQKKPTFALKEQTINNLPQSLYFLQASRIEPVTGRMREVVIYDMSPPAGRRVIYADSGYMALEDEQDLAILLYDGRIHEYKTPEPASFNVTRYATQIITVRNVQNVFEQTFGSAQRGDREMTTCEMLDEVGRSRGEVARTRVRRDALAREDARALLHLYAPPPAPDSGEPRVRSCGSWRRLEGWFGRLLLPEEAAAQAPVAARQAGSLRIAGLSSGAQVNDLYEEAAFARRNTNMFLVEIHKKLALSVACVNFVLIGVALALRFPRGGIGLVIGGSLVIFALFYVGLTVGENLADPGIVSPALAMWLPNLIVFVAGVLGLLRVNREFGSTRGGDLADLADLLFGWVRRRRRARA